MKKRKWLAGILILAMLFSLAGGGTLLAFADESDLSIVNVNWVGGYPAFVVQTDADCGAASGTWSSDDSTHNAEHVTVTFPDNTTNDGFTRGSPLGTTVQQVIWVSHGGEVSAIDRGTVLTLKQGFRVTTANGVKSLPNDVSYIYNTEGEPLVVFAPTSLTAVASQSVMVGNNAQITFAASNDSVTYANAPATYTIEDETIATVTGNGLTATVTGVKTGATTLTATCGGKTATVDITVEEAMELDSIAVTGSVSVYTKTALTEADLAGLSGTKTYKAAEGETPKTSAFDVTLAMLSDEDYDLSVPDTYSVTVTTDEKTTTFDLEVKAVPAPTMTMQEAVPSWGSQPAIRFALPHSNSLSAGSHYGSSGGVLDGIASRILIGEQQATTGTSSNTVWIATDNSTYLMFVLHGLAVSEGSIITVSSGLPLYKTLSASADSGEVFAVTTEEYKFVYDGEAWMRRVAAEGMEFTATKTRLAIDETLNLGVYFTPKSDNTAGYTENTITFETSDEAVATVSAAGVVTAVAAGSATITAKCEGLPDATYAVQVMANAEVQGIAIKENAAQSIFVGQDYTLPTVVKNVKYGEDEPVEEAVTITAENVGGTFDKNTAGTYTLTVTVDTYTATFTVEVKAPEAVTIQDMNVGVNYIFINTDKPSGATGAAQAAGDIDHFEVTYLSGQKATLESNWIIGQETYIKVYFNDYQNGGSKPEVGMLVTVKAGYRFSATAEVKETVTYIYDQEGESLKLYDPTAFTAANAAAEVMNGTEATLQFNLVRKIDDDTTVTYATAPVTYTVADPTIATVTGNGLSAKITALKEGTTKLTATCAGKTAEVNVTVTKALALKEIAVEGTLTLYKRAGQLTDADLTALVGKAKYEDDDHAETVVDFTVTADALSGTYDLSKAGTYELTVTHKEKTCKITLTVQECEEVKVSEINWDSVGWKMILVATDTDCGVSAPWGDGDATHVVVKNAIGEALTNVNVVEMGNYIYIQIGGAPEIGTILTIQKGYRFSPFAEFKEEVSYIYINANKPFEVYDPEKHDVKEFKITNKVEENEMHVKEVMPIEWEADVNTTPHFTSSDKTIATVDTFGNVEGVKEGTVTITVKAGSKTATYTVKVLAELPIKTVQLATSYKIWVEKDAALTIPQDFTAQIVFDNNGTDVLGRPFALTAENSTLAEFKTDVADTFEVELTVSNNGKDYTFKVPVEVFEIDPMEVKEVAIVEWFGFNVFAQFPNSSMNGVNFTTAEDIPDSSILEYTRVDGTQVEFGVYNLMGGNIAILPAFIDNGVTLANYGKEPYYQEGDKITLKQGLTGYCWTGDVDADTGSPLAGTGMKIRECILQEDLVYIFDGTGWFKFVAYTDMEAPEEVTVVLGETVSLRAFRVPDDANEGVFDYEIADETVVSLASNGRVTGLKLNGTTTVTVKLSGGEAGEKTKTITVKVIDGIKELSLGENAKTEVKQGTEKLDLSGLNAQLVWASGKTEKADLSNAEIIGYDKDAIGETEVTVRITVDGKTYSAQLLVNVTDAGCGCGGCGSGMTGYASVVLAVGALALAFVAILLGKKHKATK